MASVEKHQLFDLGCAAAGVACAVHCLLLPVIILSIPALGLSFFTSESFEWLLVGITLVLASASILWGLRNHGSRKPFSLLLLGAALLLLSRFLHDSHTPFEDSTALHSLETVLAASFGGLLIAAAHLMNWKLLHRTQDAHNL